MLGLVISGDRIFLCGGTSYEEDYVSNESFLFNIPQESSVIANEIQSPQQMKNRVPKKKMNRFESLAKMNKHRYSHTGIFMKGVIFVFGGKN